MTIEITTTADDAEYLPRVYTHLARFGRWQVRWAHNGKPVTASMPGRSQKFSAEFSSEADAIAHAQRLGYTIIPAPARTTKNASR
jgi:hypothetical protein